MSTRQQEPSPPHVVVRLAVAALAGLTALAAVATLWWPYGWDQGVFGWVSDTILRGGLPYRDAWDVKGPLVYYVFAAVEGVLGRGMWGIRVFDLALLAAAALAARRLVRPIAGPTAGVVAALVLVLVYLGHGYWNTAQPDSWAGLVFVLAFVPLAGPLMEGRGPGAGALAFSATLVGVAALAKPLYAVFGILPGLAALLPPSEGPLGRRLARGALLVAAFLAPVAATAAWFHAQGALDTLVDVYVRHNMRQAELERASLEPGHGVLLTGLRTAARNPALPIGGVLALLALVQLWRSPLDGERRLALLFAGWVLTASACVALQMRFWPYHRQVLNPALAVLGVVALARLARPGGVRTGWRRPLVLGVAALLLVGVALPPAKQARRWLSYMTGRQTAEEYYGNFTGGDGRSWRLVEDFAVADYLRARTRPAESVLVWTDPLVNYLADRPAPGRSVFHIPLTAILDSAARGRHRAELVEAMARERPAYLVIERSAFVVTPRPGRANLGTGWPELVDSVRAGWRVDTAIGRYDLFVPAPR